MADPALLDLTGDTVHGTCGVLEQRLLLLLGHLSEEISRLAVTESSGIDLSRCLDGCRVSGQNRPSSGSSARSLDACFAVRDHSWAGRCAAPPGVSRVSHSSTPGDESRLTPGTGRDAGVLCLGELRQHDDADVRHRCPDLQCGGTEASAYFFIADALTNAAKHSSASHVVVTLGVHDGNLNIEVRDDGMGARPRRLAPASSVCRSDPGSRRRGRDQFAAGPWHHVARADTAPELRFRGR